MKTFSAAALFLLALLVTGAAVYFTGGVQDTSAALAPLLEAHRSVKEILP